MEKKENKPALDMIEDYLKSNGYDGLKDIDESVLVAPDCRCFIDVGEDYPQHMRNCCGIERTCVAGYRCLNDDGEDDISLEKPETTLSMLNDLLMNFEQEKGRIISSINVGSHVSMARIEIERFSENITASINNIIKTEKNNKK